jgi:uncharacterized protein YcbK (DUF882 family)
MSKKIIVLVSSSILALICYSNHRWQELRIVESKKTLKLSAEKVQQSLNKKDNLNELSDRETLQKLDTLERQIKSKQHKNYSDFSEDELVQYNQQVKESVKIKKSLFLKKYAHWSNI